MKDYTGREIQVGDKIVFPRRQGAAMWMTDGVVTGINALRGTISLDNKHEVRRVDRCIVAQPATHTEAVKQITLFPDGSYILR